MDELITTDTILKYLREQIENKKPVAVELWLEAAQKLNMLSEADIEELYKMEEELADFMVKTHSEQPELSIAGIRMLSKANPLNRKISVLKAKLERIKEAVRIAKLQARLSSDNIKGYN